MLNGHKFDFRVYVLWIDDKVYINEYFYSRIAPEKYSINNVKSQITSFSLHEDKNFLYNRERFFNEYEKEYPSNKAGFLNNKLLAKMAVIAKTTINHVRKNYNLEFWNDKKNHYFNLFGFDMLPDESGKLWLMEVNATPDFGDDSKNSQVETIVEDMIRIILNKKQTSFIEIA